MALPLYRTALIGSTAGIALVLSAPVQAQATQPTESATATDDAADKDTIIVTGFRRSIQSAIESKRQADVVADIITAQDIQGLPDVSIAESLARLPGVTSQRTGGQSSALNIRGLGQGLVTATLNGREQVSTSRADAARSIEFEQYPSELINQAAVYKSPKASLIEGGIAGQVDLATVRPLAKRERISGSLNVRGQYNDRADESPDADSYGYRVSASLNFKLLDDTLGIALGYSRLAQPNVATRFVGYDYNAGNRIDVNGDGQLESPGFGFEGAQFGGNEVRDGALAVIQYEPTPDLRILIDGYYSKFSSDVRRRGVRIEGLGNIAAQDVSNVILSNGAIIGGRIQSGSGLTATSVNQDESDRNKLYTIGGNIAKDLGPVTITLDAAYSRADSAFNNSGVNVDAYDANGQRLSATRGALVVDYKLNGLDRPDIAINHDFTDPTRNLFQGFYIVPEENRDELKAFAGNVKWNIDGGFIQSLEVGGRYAMRDARRTITSFASFAIPAPVQIPAGLAKGAGFTGRFARAGLPNFLAADIDGLLDQFVGANRTVDQSQGFTRDQSFTLSEDTLAGYAQLNYAGDLGSLPLRGNIGLRVVNTDQSSTSSTNDVFVTVGDKFTEWLPSFNAVLELSERDFIRASASRQLSRAGFFDIRSSVQITFDGAGVPGGSGGNPFLRPFLANQFDLGYEHYFGNNGIFAVGAFYKDLKTFVINGTTTGFNFRENGFGALLDNAPPTATGAPKQDIGTFSQPINGQGGYVWGIEANYTHAFTDLPAPFDGLGVILNYSYTKSDLSITTSTSGAPTSITLPGLSAHVANPTVYYEKHGFGARVGVRYRSKYVAPQVGQVSNPAINAAETVVDAQLSYEFQAGSPMQGLRLLLQANNITDAPNRTYWGTEAQTSTQQYFGRQLFFGAAYSF
ncbi:MAG: TonB-dependent receptor [Alphaproteobacteria bacterium]|nr:MAG: TonB-dependent receptor [Alphaproteobacteria bacterium]